MAFLIGRTYAKSGAKDKAFEWLNRAVDVEFANIPLVETDADLSVLRGDPRYQIFVTRLRASITPCKARPEYRALDFFIGEWEQQNRAGQVVGTSSVKLTLEGCVIEETSVNPQSSYTGRAFHYFDPTLGKWRQTYVATKADFSLWTGDFKDGEIRYTGEISHANGSKTLGRNIFTRIDANRVRQLFEISTDSGKTWTTNWDGFYVRKYPAN